MTRSSDRPKRKPGSFDMIKVLNFFSTLELKRDISFLNLKSYFSPNLSSIAMKFLLQKLKGNEKIQALYLHSFDCIRDEHLELLLDVLKHQNCNIWCINIGEFDHVSLECWNLLANTLNKTKVTHMYASENLIQIGLKNKMRVEIRKNRSKHNMHRCISNMDVIKKCTNLWW